MGKIRPEKEKKERKKKAVAATATARRFSFKTVADLRLLLAVALVVLAAMGIFAWAFRQIHIGYVEEDGWVVSSSKVYNSLNSGAEEGTKILLTSVKSNDEVISRAGSYYVGADMTEYESAYPVWSNGGQSLYFLDDSASLVTEDFELLSTWGGMYVADGTSFNEAHEQVDEETIYLVKLKNGLYQNALAIRFASSNYEQTMQIYSAASFSDSYVRWFSQSSGELSYHEISDPSDLTVYIGDESYSYAEFLELLRGAGKTQAADDDEQATGSITGSDAEEAEQETITGTDTGETVKTKNEKGDSGDKGTADKESSATADATDGSAEGASGAAAASSSSGGSSSGSGSGDGTAESAAEASGARSSAAGTSGETADAAWLAPDVQLVITRIGAYDVEFEVYITDESGVLRKATINASWTGTNGDSNVRKSVREDGTYTISNLESGKTVTLTVTAKYRNSAGDYVEAVCATLTFTTLTIATGTNTLYIDYNADRTSRDEDKEGDYDEIYATQIEIQDLRVYEGSDGQMADGASTMDYVRYFYVRVYEWDAENSEASADPVQSYLLSASERTRVMSEGIDWLSDSLSALYTSTDYRYEFELLDRYGESMKVGYGTVSDSGTVTKNTGRYASDGTTALTYQDTDCDRNAYTCAADPTGKLTLGTSTYDSQTITVKFTNAASDSSTSQDEGGATVSELYLVENETAYGRYILWNGDGDDITGEIGTAVLTDSTYARYSLLEEATTETYQAYKYKTDENGEYVTDENGNYEYDTDENGAYILEDRSDTYYAYPGATADGVGEDSVGVYDDGTEYTWTKMKIPAFAGSTYTIKLYASYDTGNRQGTQYGQLLATRSNARTASLSTLGSVSFTRQNLDADDESATFSYTSSLPSTSLQPLLYKYEYDLTDEDDNTVFTLLISKDYEEISSSQQGIWLTVGSYSVEAADWTLNYSFPYTQTLGTTTSSHVVSGTISYDESLGRFTRTVYVDGDERDYTFTYPSEDEEPIDTTDNNEILAQLMVILAELDTYSTVVDPDEEEAILTSISGITNGTATVSLSFEKVTKDDDPYTVLFDADENYCFSLAASELLAACTDVEADEDTAASEKTWGYTWLYALSAERAQLSLMVGNLASRTTYTASACAYAWQTGNYTYTDDESSDAEPALVAVTTTDASLTVMTTKAEPEVYMDVFATSSEITLYGFYVYDPDGSIVAKRSGLVPTVTVSLYLVDDDGNESLVAQETVTDIATDEDEIAEYAQDLSFGGLVSGATYYIKVTADALDLTADGSDTQYNYLIGEDETNAKYVSTGIWSATLGADVETGLYLERVEESDPYTLEGQLIDYTTADAEIAAGTEGGWEVGYLTTSGTLSAHTGYRTTPYIDLRARDENGNVDTDYELSESDIFLGRNIYYLIALYDKNYEYLGYARPLWSSSSNNSTSYATLVFRLSGGPLQSGSSFELSDVVYARVSIYNNCANEAYFGRLDEDYFKTTSAEEAADAELGTDYRDVYGQVLNSGDQWDTAETTGDNAGVEADGNDGSYYSAEIKVSEDNIVMITGKNGTSPIIRGVQFYDSSGTSTGSAMGMTGSLLIVPSDTTYMKLEYKSSDSSAVGLGLYILDDDGDIAAAYEEQMGDMTATSGKGLGSNSGKDTTASSSLIEVTDSYIEVKPGDLLMISNYAQNIALYDKEGSFVSYTIGMASGYDYLIVPEGVYKVRFANSIYSTASDWSIEDGCKILFLNCGSVADIYKSKMTTQKEDYSEESVSYVSSDQLYANLRIHISDAEGTESSNFSDDSTFWLRVYSAAYNASAEDDEVSDEALEEDGYLGYALTDITLTDDDLASVNLCRFVPVTKGRNYRVELWATKGSSLQNVQLGKSYFTVDASGTPVFGLSSEAQISSLRGSTESFVLTQDVCFTDNTNSSGGTFYGTLDLQGHTLATSKGEAYLFDYIGTSSKRTTVIKNGTIAVDYERTEGTLARIAYYCYGTIRNVLFSIDASNPVLSGSGSTAVYDNSMWTSEVNSYFIQQNYGTIRNFAVEYVSDLVGCYYAGADLLQQRYDRERLSLRRRLCARRFLCGRPGDGQQYRRYGARDLQHD